MSIIYKITNTETNQSYVGWTNKTSAEDRWKIHKQCARRGQVSHFYNAVRKYGEDKFIVEELERGDDDNYMLNIREPYWISKFGFYNMTIGGNGGKTSTSFKPGHQMLDEHKKIMSEKVSKSKTDYWIKWREAHPNYKDNWKKYIPKGVSEENREMYSKQVTQRNYIKYKCVHCGKETNIGNLNRWHNDNCKEYDGNSKNKEKE